MELILNFFASIVVLLLLGTEAYFFYDWWKKQKDEKRDVTEYAPLRLLIFLVFTSQSIQDPFIARLCSQYSSQALFLSPNLATAMPFFMQLFAAAVAGFIAGRRMDHMDTKRIMRLGFLEDAAGCLLCGVVQNYYGLLFGNILIGAGMGIVMVTTYGMAAMGADEVMSAKAFGRINAGTLSGIAAGAGIGSVILYHADYRTAYIAMAVLAFAGIYPVQKSKKAKVGRLEKRESRISSRHFVSSKNIIAFLLLQLLPFMVMIYYREYFFTLYAAHNGMSDSTIGRILLFCGLFIIYMGPPLGAHIIGRYGSKGAMLRADSILLVSVIVFMIKPSLIAAVIGAVVMSISISFAYTAQNTCYISFGEVEEYGEGNAMGIYSMVENIGQMFGPILFAAFLSLGYTWGIRLLGILYGASIGLYLFLERKRE